MARTANPSPAPAASTAAAPAAPPKPRRSRKSYLIHTIALSVQVDTGDIATIVAADAMLKDVRSRIYRPDGVSVGPAESEIVTRMVEAPPPTEKTGIAP